MKVARANEMIDVRSQMDFKVQCIEVLPLNKQLIDTLGCLQGECACLVSPGRATSPATVLQGHEGIWKNSSFGIHNLPDNPRQMDWTRPDAVDDLLCVQMGLSWSGENYKDDES
ncbi:MAG: hypothetical protein ABR905_06690 [Terracidiphilus sp.]